MLLGMGLHGVGPLLGLVLGEDLAGALVEEWEEGLEEVLVEALAGEGGGGK